MRGKTLIMLFAVSAIFSGCAIGPRWNRDITLPAPSSDIRGKKVVISKFMQSVSQVSVTHSRDIQWTKESVYAHDVSGDIAAGLRASGIPAEARVDVKAAELGKDEVLVQGAVISHHYQPGGRYCLSGSVMILTMGIVGMVLPTPVAYLSGGEVTYRVDVIDSKGRLLMQTGDQAIIGTYDDYWFWGLVGGQGKYEYEVVPPVRQKIVAALAGYLKP